MSIPSFPFPFWLEIMYLYQSAQSNLYETKRALGLAFRLQLAGIPISNRYEECPELDTWGFAPDFWGLTPEPLLLSHREEMKHMVNRLVLLSTALSNPESLIGWARKNRDNRCVLLACAAVGEYIYRNYHGQLELTVRSRDGFCYVETLAADMMLVEYIRDKLQLPRNPHYQKEITTLTGIDLGRGLVYTKAGAVQIRDPDVASDAISLLEESVEMELDTDAPAVRVTLPELIKLKKLKK